MFVTPKNKKKITIKKIKNKYLKKYWQKNKSDQIAKNCCLSRCKRLRSKKINYMFLPPKNKIEKQ